MTHPNEYYKLNDNTNSMLITLKTILNDNIDSYRAYITSNKHTLDADTKHKYKRRIHMLSAFRDLCGEYVIYTIRVSTLKNIISNETLERIIEYNDFAKSIHNLVYQYQTEMLNVVRDIERLIDNNTLTPEYITIQYDHIHTYNNELQHRCSECNTKYNNLFKK